MAVALAGEHRGRLLPQRTRRVENFLTENGAVAVMESRIVPLLPWGVVNYSAGLTHFSYRDMALGTAIGAAPKVFAYTALGGNLDDLTSPEVITAVALLVILGLAGALFVWRQIGGIPWRRAAPGTPQKHQRIPNAEHVRARPAGGDGEDVAEEPHVRPVDEVRSWRTSPTAPRARRSRARRATPASRRRWPRWR